MKSETVPDASKKVLLIDNDEAFLRATARELLVRGYRVEEASDGLEGVQKALQDPPDIAVVDLIMPRVGGAEVVSFFRQNPYLSSLPIVLLSGVVIENAQVVNSLDVDLIVAKGSFEDTIGVLVAGLERLGNGGRGKKEVFVAPQIRQRTQVTELLNIKRDLGLVLEGVGAAILEMDPSGRVVYANGRAEEFMGVDRASLIGTDILSIFPKAGLANLRTLLFRFEGDAGPTSRTMTAVMDGRVMQAVLTSVWSERGRHGIVATLFEIAPHVEAQTRTLRLVQYLCHEMRSSLLIIEGYLRSLVGRSVVGRAGEVTSGDQASILSFLARETARLLRLVGDASKFHRAIRELPDIEMEPVDFLNVVEDSISGVTALAANQGIEVAFKGARSIPKVRGNHDKLLQVLYNLLLNAVKFTPRGGSVCVEVEVQDGEILTTVVDTGRGIPADELREILVQAERPELFLPLKGRRVGMGLAIALQIIRAHRGRFHAESKVGVGSRFRFTLPLWPEDAQEQFNLPYASLPA
jgi:PAS domain S-box-containing protein